MAGIVTKRLVLFAVAPTVLAGLLCASAPLRAESVAIAEPAVPNIPRTVTPTAPAAAPAESPDASHIDASGGAAGAAPASPAPASSASALDAQPLDAKPLDTAPNGSETTNGIVATVNDAPISDFELRERMALVSAISIQKPLNQLKPDELAQLRAQTLAKLEDEKLQFLEAQKQSIVVSPVEIDRQVDRMLADNHLTLDQLKKVLSDAGSSYNALRDQIEIQIAWAKTVNDQYGDHVIVTPAETEAEMARQAEGATKPHYLVAEIFLPVENPDEDSKVEKDAEQLESQLGAGAPFNLVARQNSRSSTAADGGNMGWVYDGQLASALNSTLATMKPGDISKPIRSVGGYYILALEARQEPLGTKIEKPVDQATKPDGAVPLARLLLPLGGGATKADLDAAMKIAGQVRASYAGCAQLAQLPQKIQGVVYYDMGAMKLSDLSPDIQKAVAATPPGEMAPPMMSEAGIELLARCDPRVEVRTAYTLKSKEEIEQQLFDEQISVLAKRYLRDLKRDADIEERGKPRQG
jgi:peptidyl-prolyl cis-trans isomerase SurA